MRLRALAVLVLGVLALAVAGCGGSEETSPTAETVEGTTETTGMTGTETQTGTAGGEVKGDPAAGKTIFDEQGCGSCHTLADAGTSGSVGPDLDDAKPPYELIIDRVTNGKSPMPSFKDKLSEKQIQDVAAYVFTSTHS
jgi:mono/diheme cytochrome c family protein